MTALTSQVYAGSQKSPSLPWKTVVLMPGKKNCLCSSSLLSVLSRWDMFFWASLLLTGWPLPTALEPNPSSFIRAAIGSQLSGDGDTTELIGMSSYLTLQPTGTGSCLPASLCCWHGKMAPDQATQEKQQAELLLGSHHGFPPPGSFHQRKAGRWSIPHCSRGRKSPKPSFLPAQRVANRSV